MGWITEQTLRSLLQYWLPMEDVWFSFSSLTLSPHHPHSDIHQHTTKLHFALSLNSFAVGLHVWNVYAQAVNVSNQQHILYMAIASKPIFNLQWKCFAMGVCWTYSIIYWADIKFESLVGCLLKSWPCPPLIKLIHGFNKWGTGGRCACRCAHKAQRHPSHWSGIFSCFSMQHSHKTPADVAGLQPSLTQG